MIKRIKNTVELYLMMFFPIWISVGRFIPIVRSLVSIPAGMAKMAFIPFLALTTVGSLIWNTVLITLGRIAGASWGRIADYIGGYSDVVLIGFIIIFILGIVAFYLKKKWNC